jgi:hypothetical protein
MNVEDKDLNDHINLLEIKLEKIYQEKAKGAQERAREQWVALGETNNSYCQRRICLFHSMSFLV